MVTASCSSFVLTIFEATSALTRNWVPLNDRITVSFIILFFLFLGNEREENFCVTPDELGCLKLCVIAHVPCCQQRKGQSSASVRSLQREGVEVGHPHSGIYIFWF